TLPPDEFATDAKKEIDKCLAAIKGFFMGEGEQARLASWRAWERKWAPRGETATEYLLQLQDSRLPYLIPLKSFLLNRKAQNQDFHWDVKIGQAAEIDPGFQWPEILAAAMPSVVTRFNLNPPPPRQYSTTDTVLLEDLSMCDDVMNPFYVLSMNTKVLPLLVLELKRKGTKLL
ncbi:hypothetical protein B484DRAFT_408835, partial [Ochromonadaceae sp. CCMP2298]